MSYAQQEYDAKVSELWEKRLECDRHGKTLPSLKNAVHILTHAPAFKDALRMDLFQNRIMVTKPLPWRDSLSEWTENDTVHLRCYLSTECDVEFGMLNIEHAVISVAQQAGFHPVRDYFNALTWDGTPRVPYWLGMYLDATRYSAQEHREYVYSVGAMWLVAAVARVFEPGCKFDNVLILEGSQGIGKSTAMSILAGDWYLDTPFPLGDKDGYQALAGVLIGELSELDNFSSVESTRSKAFFSSGVDRYRPPYGRTVQAFARQCVFVGTTNEHEYLKDSTGNRRYWPVRVHQLDRDALMADRDQLWAEAVHLYRQGFKYYLPADHPLLPVFEAEQAIRSITDPWELAIADWLGDPTNPARDCCTQFQLLKSAIGVDTNRMDQRSMSTRVGKIMRRLGYKKIEATTREQRRKGRFVYVPDSCQT